MACIRKPGNIERHFESSRIECELAAEAYKLVLPIVSQRQRSLHNQQRAKEKMKNVSEEYKRRRA